MCEFPSLKGFDLAIDLSSRSLSEQTTWQFPSLKGFDLAIDPRSSFNLYAKVFGFHPSKGSTSL